MIHGEIRFVTNWRTRLRRTKQRARCRSSCIRWDRTGSRIRTTILSTWPRPPTTGRARPPRRLEERRCMVISARRIPKRGGPGVTLLELLLTVALLMALLAAVVFNFAPLKTGASLEEGGREFEALIRFASAQAAQSGRVVQFRFDEAVADSGSRTNEGSEISEGAEKTKALRVMRE